MTKKVHEYTDWGFELTRWKNIWNENGTNKMGRRINNNNNNNNNTGNNKTINITTSN